MAGSVKVRTPSRGGTEQVLSQGQSVEVYARAGHLMVGATGLIAFLYTGQYMAAHFPNAYEDREAIRYLYRANHLYVMFGSLLHIALGRYLALASSSWRRVMQLCGSVALLAAEVLLIGAFFWEPQFGGTIRRTTLVGCLLALGGILAHGLAGQQRR